MRHTIPATTAEHGASIIEPPFHYHIYQTERFRVVSGEGVFWRGIDSKPWATLSSKSSAQSAAVEPRRYHRFENASKTEDLVIDVQLDPEDDEGEQRFFRNFFGYLDDCKSHKVAPSFFQLMVFLYEADTPLALPLPYEWLGVWVSRLFLIAVAFVGHWVLGYRTSYPEYYAEKKSR